MLQVTLMVGGAPFGVKGAGFDSSFDFGFVFDFDSDV
jgi:hypothetical protein